MGEGNFEACLQKKKKKKKNSEQQKQLIKLSIIAEGYFSKELFSRNGKNYGVKVTGESIRASRGPRKAEKLAVFSEILFLDITISNNNIIMLSVWYSCSQKKKEKKFLLKYKRNSNSNHLIMQWLLFCCYCNL